MCRRKRAPLPCAKNANADARPGCARFLLISFPLFSFHEEGKADRASNSCSRFAVEAIAIQPPPITSSRKALKHASSSGDGETTERVALAGINFSNALWRAATRSESAFLVRFRRTLLVISGRECTKRHLKLLHPLILISLLFEIDAHIRRAGGTDAFDVAVNLEISHSRRSCCFTRVFRMPSPPRSWNQLCRWRIAETFQHLDRPIIVALVLKMTG